MQRLTILLIAAGALTASWTGCSLSVKSTLDGKGDAPTSTCDTNVDCSGTATECRAMDDGITQYNDCVCSFGFVPVDGSDDCEWDESDTAQGIVMYPGFSVPDGWPEPAPEVDDVWSRIGDIGFDDSDSGGGDEGIIEIGADGVCEAARVFQAIDLSSRDVTGPMVIDAQWRSITSDPHGHVPAGGVPLGVGIDGRWIGLYADGQGTDWVSVRTCIGGSLSGQQIDFSVGPYAPINDCLHANTIGMEVSRADIVPADPGECPANDDAVENPDFEGSEMVWTKKITQGMMDLTIVPGVGDMGTQALDMNVTQTCMAGGAVTNVTLSDDAEALSFWWSADVNQWLEVRLGADVLATFQGTGAQEFSTFCIPPYLRGLGAELYIGTRNGYSSCNAGPMMQIDNVAIHQQPECKSNAFAQDSGFELVTTPGFLGGVPSYTTGATLATALDAPLLARDGDGVYSMSTTNSCNSLCDTCTGHPEFAIAAPARNEIGGSAISFWYRAQNMPAMQTRTTLDASDGWLAEDLGGWQRHSICVGDAAGGRPSRFRFVFTAEAACGAIPLEEIFIDDLEAFNDPACD